MSGTTETKELDGTRNFVVTGPGFSVKFLCRSGSLDIDVFAQGRFRFLGTVPVAEAEGRDE